MAESISASRGSRTGTENTNNTARNTDAIRASRKMRLQLVMAVILAIFGMVLFIASFIVPPTGILDSSVLVAGGEVFTFSGSLLGLDYRYRYSQHQKYSDNGTA